MNFVIINGEKVFYHDRGKGLPILMLPGWGGTADDLFPLQDALKDRGYRTIVIELPGLGSPSIRILLEEWTVWLDEFVKMAGIEEQLVMFSHSLSARIALKYLVERETLCGIFLNPCVVTSRFWKSLGDTMRYLGLDRFIPERFKWMRDDVTWQSACSLFNKLSEEEVNFSEPSLVITCSFDPVKYLFPGFKRIPGEKVNYLGDHSPHYPSHEKNFIHLVNEIDEFIKRKLVVK